MSAQFILMSRHLEQEAEADPVLVQVGGLGAAGAGPAGAEAAEEHSAGDLKAHIGLLPCRSHSSVDYRKCPSIVFEYSDFALCCPSSDPHYSQARTYICRKSQTIYISGFQDRAGAAAPCSIPEWASVSKDYK